MSARAVLCFEPLATSGMTKSGSRTLNTSWSRNVRAMCSSVGTYLLAMASLSLQGAQRAESQVQACTSKIIVGILCFDSNGHDARLTNSTAIVGLRAKAKTLTAAAWSREFCQPAHIILRVNTRRRDDENWPATPPQGYTIAG